MAQIPSFAMCKQFERSEAIGKKLLSWHIESVHRRAIDPAGGAVALGNDVLDGVPSGGKNFDPSRGEGFPHSRIGMGGGKPGVRSYYVSGISVKVDEGVAPSAIISPMAGKSSYDHSFIGEIDGSSTDDSPPSVGDRIGPSGGDTGEGSGLWNEIGAVLHPWSSGLSGLNFGKGD